MDGPKANPKTRKRIRSPPHPGPLTSKEKRFVFILLIISLVVILLSFLAFLAPPLAGKAAYVVLPTGEKVDLTLTSDNKLLLTANLGLKSTNAVYFELTADFPLCSALGNLTLSVTNPLWNQFYEVSCQDKKLTFADATLNNADFKSGSFPLANLSLSSLPSQEIKLNLTPLDVYDSSTGQDFFPAGQEFSFSPPPPPETGRREKAPCTSAWSCSTWSFCNSSLKQFRTCYDQNNCLPSKEETRSCPQCQESWICSQWSSCYDNLQTRVCYDEHKCNTFALKPSLQKACQAPEPSPLPTRISPTPPERFAPPPEVPPKIERPQPFWDQYKTYLIALPSALIFITLLVFLILHFRKPKANIAELKDWLNEGLSEGYSPQQLRETLRQQTAWTDQDIDQAFKELR